jgi:hypothetical protein
MIAKSRTMTKLCSLYLRHELCSKLVGESDNKHTCAKHALGGDCTVAPKIIENDKLALVLTNHLLLQSCVEKVKELRKELRRPSNAVPPSDAAPIDAVMLLHCHHPTLPPLMLMLTLRLLHCYHPMLPPLMLTLTLVLRLALRCPRPSRVSSPWTLTLSLNPCCVFVT